MSMIFPFAQNPSQSIPQVINYDLIIQEEFPGIAFVPTLPGGVYSEIRNVDGCFWFVINAMWNPSSLQWEQDSPANPAEPAYALVQCESTGTLAWKIAPAAGAPNTALVWTTVWQLDKNGGMTIEPLTLTGITGIAERIAPIWDAGSAAKMIARQVGVTDTSSEADSALDQLLVDNVVEWEVRKDGTLVVGKIPASAIVGGIISSVVGAAPSVTVVTVGSVATVSLSHGDYVDLANAQTISGVKTFTPSIFLGSSTGSEGTVIGNTNGTAHGYGAEFAVGPFTWLAHATTACIWQLTFTGTFNFFSDSGLTIGNTYNPTLRLSIAADGSIPTGGTIPPSTLAGEFEGTGGVVVSYDGGANKVDVNGSAFVLDIASSDGSIDVAGTTQHPTVKVDVSVLGAVVMYNEDGTKLAGGVKVVKGSVVIPGGTTSTVVTLVAPATFTNDTTYVVLMQNYQISLPPSTPGFFVNNNSGSQFTIINGSVAFSSTLKFAAIGV